MLQKIINFVKYHNAFAIGISLVLVLSLSAMASEDIRDTVIGQEIITEQGIDNSAILAADLNNFNFQLTIQNVSEDPLNYYLDYTYQTLAIKDNIWQLVLGQNSLIVSKEALGERDLGLYAAEELAEVIDYQLSYLKEVQELEKEKGQSQIVQSTTYTGLLGLVLSEETKELAGYVPVLQPLEPEVIVFQPEPQPALQNFDEQNLGGQVVQEPLQQPTIQPSIDREMIREIIKELLAEQQGEPPPPAEPTSTEPTPTEPTCQPTEEICDQIDNNCDGQIDEGEVCQTAPPACTPNWQCQEWTPVPETVSCGRTFSQTRTCPDLNSCGTNEGKPIESQETTGNLCSAQNATGTCQSGTCSFTCQEGYSDCDNDWLNGCETQGECQPPPTGQ